MYCDRLKTKNLLDFCENLLENLLKCPKKSKSKSAMTPVLELSPLFFILIYFNYCEHSMISWMVMYLTQNGPNVYI